MPKPKPENPSHLCDRKACLIRGQKEGGREGQEPEHGPIAGLSPWGSDANCYLPKGKNRLHKKSHTQIIKQNLSLICKCQQQYKIWSDGE